MNVPAAQKQKARIFLKLHHQEDVLVLPNIWDPIGARILASQGYPAVATASAAIAESLGYADGENLQLSTMLQAIARIARSVDLPVSADLEAGYAATLSELRENTCQLIETGVVGINLEDSLVEGGPLRPLDEQCERIAAVREAAAGAGLHLVINARVDSFLSETLPAAAEKLEDALQRGQAYTRAGADCIYPIGPADRETLAALRAGISGPLNVLGTPQALSIVDLQQMGIQRISFGPFIFRSCLAKLVEIGSQLKAGGSYDCFAKQRLSQADVAAYLQPGKE